MTLRQNVDRLLSNLERQYDTHNRIEVSKKALLHNLDLFRAKKQQVIPVLKGNAYGHGIELVAAALKDRSLPYLAVDGYFEALRIRKINKQQPVLIMGAIKPSNYKQMRYDRFAFVVDSATTIHALGKTSKKLKIHLECNTGMNRYGAQPKEIASLTSLILGYKNLELEGIMSHLADSDGDNPQSVAGAVKLFDECVDTARDAGAKPAMLHIAQSAGSLKARSQYANTMRLGIALYGINPFSKKHPLHNELSGLQPALRLVSTITKVIQLKKGEKVSYNYTFTAPKDMTIGVLPLGYFEGLNRALSNQGVVKVSGNFLPIIGRICMNHTMINLAEVDARVGDEVIAYSDKPDDPNSIDEIAHSSKLFNYALLTSLSRDIRRGLVD